VRRRRKRTKTRKRTRRDQDDEEEEEGRALRHGFRWFVARLLVSLDYQLSVGDWRLATLSSASSR
jgi:hypothetical protein